MAMQNTFCHILCLVTAEKAALPRAAEGLLIGRKRTNGNFPASVRER
jgi:hypothetical protein